MRPGWQWPLIIAALMGVVLVANLTLLFVATSDPSFAVEQDYYDKAVRWGDRQAQEARNAELGWSLDFRVATTGDAAGLRRIDAELSDEQGLRLADATVRVEAFHNARASAVLDAAFSNRGEGRYAASLPLRRPGLWEFRFEVTRGADRFTRTVVRDVVPSR